MPLFRALFLELFEAAGRCGTVLQNHDHHLALAWLSTIGQYIGHNVRYYLLTALSFH